MISERGNEHIDKVNTEKPGHSRIKLEIVSGAIPDLPKRFHTSNAQELIQTKNQADLTLAAINGTLIRMPNLVKCLDAYSATKDLEWRH